MKSLNITPIEKRVLRSLHLIGIMGNCGTLNKKQRLNLLNDLIKKGCLNANGQVTKKGIEVSV